MTSIFTVQWLQFSPPLGGPKQTESIKLRKRSIIINKGESVVTESPLLIKIRKTVAPFGKFLKLNKNIFIFFAMKKCKTFGNILLNFVYLYLLK